MPDSTRRDLLKVSAAAALAPAALVAAQEEPRGDLVRRRFRISLAQWSLHRTIGRGELDPLHFPEHARKTWGFGAVEYVSSFFRDKARDTAWLAELAGRCRSVNVKSLLIMVDGEGALGDPDPAKRAQAVTNHHQWVDAAVLLGCHSIRVNAQSAGTWEEQCDRAADGLLRLTEYAAARCLNVIVENHGGLSSNGAWLAEVMRTVNHERCGTLPDFGNFHLGNGKQYDRYKGVRELMPFAKAVSAKSHDFNDDGNETSTDYARMLDIVRASGYHGWIGVEYEGSRLPEAEGIRLTKRLLERLIGLEDR